MTPNAFKAHFEVLFKIYDNLKADYELTIGLQKKTFLFFDTFSAEQCNLFIQQQRQYHKVMMDMFIDFFQICH